MQSIICEIPKYLLLQFNNCRAPDTQGAFFFIKTVLFFMNVIIFQMVIRLLSGYSIINRLFPIINRLFRY